MKNLINEQSLKHSIVHFTPSETANRLRFGRPKIYELLRSGKISHIRIGRRLLIPAMALEEFERRHTTEAKS